MPEIEGGAGRVHRAEPQLVRVPIVWRGQTQRALALRLRVEGQRADGTWYVPQANKTSQAR